MQYVMSRPRALTAPSIPTLALFLLSVLAGCGGEEAAQPSEKVGGADGVDEAVRDEADGPEDPNEHTHEGNEDLARILTTDALHDFGQVWQGSVVAHEFEFTAGGAVDLSILDYKPDCGCTVAHLEMINEDGSRSPYELKTPVPPGTRFALAATFDTKGREGVQGKAVGIFANIPGGRRDMTLQANIKPFLTVEPLVGRVDKMSVLDSAATEFRVKSVSGERFKLSATRLALPDQLEVECVAVDGSGDDGRASSWKVNCTLNAGMPEGIRTYPIELRTDLVNENSQPGPDGEPLPFVISPMISAMIVGPVAALPQNLNFGMVAGDQVVAKTVRIESHDPGFRLPEPKARVRPYKEGASIAFSDTLHITTRELEGENAWEVELLLDGLAPEVGRSFLGYLVIETGHPDKPKLEITLSGLKRGS